MKIHLFIKLSLSFTFSKNRIGESFLLLLERKDYQHPHALVIEEMR